MDSFIMSSVHASETFVSSNHVDAFVFICFYFFYYERVQDADYLFVMFVFGADESTGADFVLFPLFGSFNVSVFIFLIMFDCVEFSFNYLAGGKF